MILIDNMNKAEFNHSLTQFHKQDLNTLHHENGPAWIFKTGSKEYWLFGKPHNINGPAIVSVGLYGYYSYFLEGMYYHSESSWKVAMNRIAIRNTINIKFYSLINWLGNKFNLIFHGV